MKKKSVICLSLISGLFIVLLVSLSIIFGGLYNVGATDDHTQPIEWILRTTMKNSVRNHAADITVPDTLDLMDPGFARQFYGHYSAACRTCHGTPGQKADPWMVIYPPASDLTEKEVVEQWSDAELYWIIKYGIKNTGMMALGPTHSDKDIWGVTALVRQLPNMSPEEYKAMAGWHKEMQKKKLME